LWVNKSLYRLAADGMARSLVRKPADLYACPIIDCADFEGLYSVSGSPINGRIKK